MWKASLGAGSMVVVAVAVAACGSAEGLPSGQDCPAGEQFVDGACSPTGTPCEKGEFGPSCEPCDCLYGTCSEGLEGDGSCTCESGWLGARCDEPDPMDPPSRMRLRVDKQGQERTFVLDRYSVRANGAFPVQVVSTNGIEPFEIEAGIRTYRGWCEEEPDASVSAMLLPSGSLRYRVFKGDPSKDWMFIPQEEFEDAPAEVTYVVVGGEPLAPNATALEDARFVAGGSSDDPMFVDAYRNHLGIIMAKSYLDMFAPKDWHTVIRKIESTIARTNNTYLRDVLTETFISGVVIRTDVENDWDASRADFDAVLPEVKPNNVFTVTDEKGSGLAYVCVLGGAVASANQNRYAVGKSGPGDDGTFYGVFRHEIGHNFGAGHYEGGAPEGKTLLSGNSLSRLSSYEVASMMECRRPGKGGDATRFAEKLGPYRDYMVPPYARLDDQISASFGGGGVAVDVLANDHDANGDLIALSAFEETSALGGTVAFASTSGPNERDRLLYTPPAIDLNAIAVGACGPGKALDPSDCTSCIDVLATPVGSCTGSQDCASGSVCVGSRCRLSPACEPSSVTDACGRPCVDSGLVLWLDGDETSTMADADGDRGAALADGDEITTWFDRSGSVNDAVAFVATKRASLISAGPDAVSGRSAMRFDADIMEVRDLDVRPETTEAVTSIAVVRHVSGDGGRMIWVQQQNGFEKRAHAAKGGLVDAVGLSSVVFEGPAATGKHWFSGVPVSTDEKPLKPGGSSVALGALLYTQQGGEGYYHTNMVLAELLVYGRALSDGERRKVEMYLAKKWGLSFKDRFSYSVADTTGMRGDGFVLIDLK